MVEHSGDRSGFPADAVRRARAAFFDLSLDLCCIADLDGRFLDVNGSWELALGWTRAQLTARPYLEFVHPDDRQSTIDAQVDLRDGVRVIEFQNRYRHADGSWRWLSWRAIPDVDAGIVYAIARDVTDQRRLEQELRDANDEQRAAAELKDRFIATASHELRTPVTSIAGFSATIRDRWDDLEQSSVRSFVELIHEQSQRLLRVVDGLHAMARLDAGAVHAALVPVDARAVLDAAALVADDTVVDVHCDSDLSMLADRRLLDVVLHNLVTNAVQYGRAPLHLSACSLGDVVRIRVEDHGDGVPESFQPYLFDKLAQASRVLTDPVFGTGLGLSITEALVHLMRGRIHYEDRDGGGACFVVDLPVVVAA
jgi:PAS domain S-box-containing protein